jgi:AraC-like DNA-binding protein
VHEGDLIIYRTTTPYLYGVTRQMRQVQVDIPVETLLETLPLPDVLAPIKIDGALHAGRALMQPLRREMLEFVENPLADHADAASRRIRSMVQMLMRAHLSDRAASRDLRLLRAEAFIAEHLSDPELDAEAVARHLSMSLRNLNRIFEQRDCSVTQWIWRERLALAHRMLADSVHAGLTIGTIALQCGFATQAHFAHAFKEEFGLTPSEHRLGARANASRAYASASAASRRPGTTT